MKSIKKYVLWAVLGVITGAICGLCGTAFSKSVELVTNIRNQNAWLLFLLPIAGLLSVLIYKICNVKNTGTTNVFDCVRTEQNLPPLLAPAIFCATCISHLFGASAGREGAALQIGGGVANVLSKIFKFDEDTRHVTLMCGMAALFSAVFGTPLAACVFVIEVIITRLCLAATIPVLLSSVTAFVVAQVFHVHPERFDIGALPEFSVSFFGKTIVIIIAGVLTAYVFCKGLSLGKSLAKKTLKNEYLRIIVGGVAIVVLTLLVKSYDYNGGGVNIIEQVFEGYVKYEAFALKILFTIICVAAGYKGGEIIPTLFIGATLGGALGRILEMPVGTSAAIGMAILFVCATKCPFATILLCGEMFGFDSLLIIAPVAIVSYLASHKLCGLYSNSKDIIELIKSYKKA